MTLIQLPKLDSPTIDDLEHVVEAVRCSGKPTVAIVLAERWIARMRAWDDRNAQAIIAWLPFGHGVFDEPMPSSPMAALVLEPMPLP